MGQSEQKTEQSQVPDFPNGTVTNYACQGIDCTLNVGIELFTSARMSHD